jgi:hypothetical protein
MCAARGGGIGFDARYFVRGDVHPAAAIGGLARIQGRRAAEIISIPGVSPEIRRPYKNFHLRFALASFT